MTADVIVLDLEDSVPPMEKMRAREVVRDSIKMVAESGAEVYARVNAWDTGLIKGDLPVPQARTVRVAQRRVNNDADDAPRPLEHLCQPVDQRALVHADTSRSELTFT